MFLSIQLITAIYIPIPKRILTALLYIHKITFQLFGKEEDIEEHLTKHNMHQRSKQKTISEPKR